MHGFLKSSVVIEFRHIFSMQNQTKDAFNQKYLDNFFSTNSDI